MEMHLPSKSHLSLQATQKEIKMGSFRFFVFGSLIAILTHPAFASPILHKMSKKTETQEVVVPLSNQPMQVIAQNEETQKERSIQNEFTAEVSMSSWSPQNLNLKSRGTTSSKLEKSLPETQLIFGTSPKRALRFLGGINFSYFSKDGANTQVAYLPSFSIQAEYAPFQLSRSAFCPYVMGALKPSFIITNRSISSDGETDFGVPFQAGIGTYYQFTSTLSADAKIIETVGSVGESDFSGLGFGFGMQVTL